MKKVVFTSGDTVSDLIKYFDDNFALTTGVYKSFLDYYNNKSMETWLNLFIDLLLKEDLNIYEYDYIYDNSLYDEYEFSEPIWIKVKNCFHGKGSYITPLRMNVVHFIGASARFFNADECEVEVCELNSLLFSNARTLVKLGGISLNEMVDIFISFRDRVDNYLFFPYPQNDVNKDIGILNIEHFFMIKITERGINICKNIKDKEMKEAIEKLNTYLN